MERPHASASASAPRGRKTVNLLRCGGGRIIGSPRRPPPPPGRRRCCLRYFRLLVFICALTATTRRQSGVVQRGPDVSIAVSSLVHQFVRLEDVADEGSNVPYKNKKSRTKANINQMSKEGSGSTRDKDRQTNGPLTYHLYSDPFKTHGTARHRDTVGCAHKLRLLPCIMHQSCITFTSRALALVDKLLQQRDQVQKLLVISVIEPALDGDAIVDLRAWGCRGRDRIKERFKQNKSTRAPQEVKLRSN